MNTPLVLIDADEAEADELAALGVERQMAPEETDALASVLLRRMGECARDVARYEAARDLEIVAIRARYERLIQPVERRHEMCESTVETLATRADFGRAKSRNVGFGRYGKRHVPERVRIVDPKAALAWAIEFAPATVRVSTVVEKTLMHSAVVPVVIALVQATGEVPPCFEHAAEHDEAFAAPSSPLAGEIP